MNIIKEKLEAKTNTFEINGSSKTILVKNESHVLEKPRINLSMLNGAKTDNGSPCIVKRRVLQLRVHIVLRP